jgi:hypothetical protein
MPSQLASRLLLLPPQLQWMASHHSPLLLQLLLLLLLQILEELLLQESVLLQFAPAWGSPTCREPWIKTIQLSDEKRQLLNVESNLAPRDHAKRQRAQWNV